MPGETERTVLAQPDWLRQVPTGLRLPEGARVVFTGCGTSFHAAQTGGRAVQALEAVLSPPDADLLVCVSHEGDTPLTLEAAQAFAGPKWLVTGKASSPLAELAEEIVVCTPEVERSWCHTASYTCAVAAIAALRGEDVSWLAGRGRGGAPADRAGAVAGKDPRRGRGPRLADGAGGGAEAARGSVGLGRRASHRTAAARPSRRDRPDGARLCPRGRGPRGRTCPRRGRGAARARLRDGPRPDTPPGRGHRPLPAPHPRHRRGARHRSGPDSPRRHALGDGPAPRTARSPCRASGSGTPSPAPAPRPSRRR